MTAPAPSTPATFPPSVKAAAERFMHERTIAFVGDHPVYTKGEPSQYGSGVLLQVADTKFIVTAYHVVELFQKEGCSAFLGAVSTEKLVFLEGCSIRWSAKADVAILVPPPSVFAQFPPQKRFTRLPEVACGDPADTVGGAYGVLGYPSSEWRVDHEARQFTMWARPAFGVPYRNAGGHFDPKMHVSICFDKAANPDPNGMSGGGIWRIHQAGVPHEQWTESDIQLVGIEHTSIREADALYGSRMEYVLGLILNYDPSLRPAIELQWPRKARTDKSASWVIQEEP